MKSPIQRQMELFSAALEHPAGPERDAFLANACAGDDALLDCVRTLLAGHSQAGSFLAQAAGPGGPTGTHLLPSTEKPGDKIGRYKLLQQIGEGGCGTVYMAEQEEPVRRRVALKVIRLGMDTKSVIARFEAERQALALMDHPNIAKVFDGGATESGRPYFVMELVRGIKITEYCDQAYLSTTERLNLFIQVCQAVQHAHQKGIIHRDIKPSNILVTVNDGVAVPKVIDFGIAKATDQRLTDKSYFTEFHAFIGTPAYTSPEQAEMSSLDIDTRSDIYSLGVLLYELLTGQTPFPSERLMQSGLDEMRRIIREEEPPRPSTRLTTLPLADASELSRKRQLKIPALANAVEGDIDWIVMKALEKDRSRRYATSLDFAADLERHLSNEAVLARPPSPFYRLQRTYRRNRLVFAAAGCVFMSMAIAVWFMALSARREGLARVRESVARNAAEQQRQEARADRDRARLAESNATVHAIEATNALLTANERMVKLNVAEGWRRVEEGDHFGALLPFAEAFALEQDKPDRAEIHQMRLASVLQRSPKLVNVWSVGTNINRAEFNRDGTKLLTASTLSATQAVARIWDTKTGRPLTEPMEHRGKITSLQWSQDETWVVTGSADYTARVWDAVAGRPVGSALVHEGPVLRAQLSSDKASVLTFGMRLVGGVVRFDRLSLWNVADGKPVWRTFIPGPNPVNNPVGFSPDYKHPPDYKYSSNRFVITAHVLFDERTGVALTNTYPTTRRESSGYNERISRGEAYMARDAAEMDDHVPDGWESVVQSADYLSLNRDTDAKVFINHGEGLASLYGLETLRTSPLRDVIMWSQRDGPYLGRFDSTSCTLATGNGDSTARIWDLCTRMFGEPIQQTDALEHPSLVSDLCFSPDGDWLATGTIGGEARIWDAFSGRPLTPWLPHVSRVLRLTFSSDRRQLFVANHSGTISIWSLEAIEAPRFAWRLPDFYPDRERSTRLSSDGKILLTRLETNSAVKAWSLVDGSLLIPPVDMEGDVSVIDSHLIVRQQTDWCVISLRDGAKATYSVSNWFRLPGPIHISEPPDNGRWISAYQMGGNELLIIDLVTGTLHATLRCPAPLAGGATIRPDGRQVVAFDREGRFVVWNLPATEPSVSMAPEFQRDTRNTGLIYSPGGRWLFGGCCYDRMKETRTLQDVQFPQLPFRDYEWLDSKKMSHDERWGLFHVAEGLRVANVTNTAAISPEIRHRGKIVDSGFSADDRLVFTSGSDPLLRSWTVPNGEPALLPMSFVPRATKLLVPGDGRGLVTVHDVDRWEYVIRPDGTERIIHGGATTLRFSELPKGKRPVSDWLALARFFARGRGDAIGGTGGGAVQSGISAADSPLTPALSPLKGEGVANGAPGLSDGPVRAADLSSAGTERTAANAGGSIPNPSTAQRAPSPLNGERAGVRGENDDWATHPPKSFRDEWLALRTKHPEVFTVSADEIDAWHRHEAWRFESRNDWSNAVHHLTELLKTHPDSGDFLPRRAAAYTAWASELVGAEVTRLTNSAASTPSVRPLNKTDQSLLTSAATNYLERALADYNRTLAWVDRFPAIAKESRLPFVEKRREVLLKLGRTAEAEADERELKAIGT